jgi:hypothetical protein
VYAVARAQQLTATAVVRKLQYEMMMLNSLDYGRTESCSASGSLCEIHAARRLLAGGLERKEKIVRTATLLLLSLILVAASYGQSAPAKWQVGTIIEAKELAPTPEQASGVIRFEVTLRVAKTDYVALYTQPKASKGVAPYRAGQDLLVLIGSNTVKYNDMLGRMHELPIIRQQKVTQVVTPEKPKDKR